MIKNQLDWQNLIEQLSSGSDEGAVEAAKLLSHHCCEECILALTQFVRSEQLSVRRELALYAMAWMQNPQLIDTFIQVLTDTDEAENVRGQAAEALGMLFDGNSEEFDNYRKSEKALLEAISDSSPVVRFWCCYGLGVMRSHRAIECLETIQERDYGLCPGWWYICEEAEDALACIAGQSSAERIPVHLRES